MSSNDKVFKQLSIKVGMRFIAVVYNPLNKYRKSIKKADSSVKREYKDFLFRFRKIVSLRSYLELNNFTTNNTQFNSILVSTCKLVDDTHAIYGMRVYDVLLVIINKLLDKKLHY